ncbi:MAG: hydroxymethylglutaryl-CoA reductase, degradative [Bacteriovoracaceae bacterium]|nr:hydroxymethylglutaryl-CoA reductase, degradative [Bacteriovoracaceae bacterium]
MQRICGFSKLGKLQKLDFVVNKYLDGSTNARELMIDSWHRRDDEQKLLEQFSENTVTNFHLPYGVIPELFINGKSYCVPMVTEESSVVAACARSAKFWRERGGFHSEVISTTKVGQIHFSWHGDSSKLKEFFTRKKDELLLSVEFLNKSMALRGGGISGVSLVDRTEDEPRYYQLLVEFETCNAMGANFINSVIEAMAENFSQMVVRELTFSSTEKEIEIIMAIVSNYNQDCVVKTSVRCLIKDLLDPKLGLDPDCFVRKFKKAVRISKIDRERAVTHNKGIMNGIDAVVLATGNDFRAVEACVHAWASRSGKYQGLTDVDLSDGHFEFSMKIPMSIGTVGGLTSLHPMARLSLDMLGLPDAEELMSIIASVGLAQNFAAIRSLITDGIQRGHMKMHLMNILNHLEANEEEKQMSQKYFSDRVISFTDVRDYLAGLRNYH